MSGETSMYPRIAEAMDRALALVRDDVNRDKLHVDGVAFSEDAKWLLPPLLPPPEAITIRRGRKALEEEVLLRWPWLVSSKFPDSFRVLEESVFPYVLALSFHEPGEEAFFSFHKDIADARTSFRRIENELRDNPGPWDLTLYRANSHDNTAVIIGPMNEVLDLICDHVVSRRTGCRPSEIRTWKETYEKDGDGARPPRRA